MMKTYSWILASLMVLAFASCSNDDGTAASQNNPQKIHTKITTLSGDEKVLEGKLRVLVHDMQNVEESKEDFVLMGENFITYKLIFSPTQDLSELASGKLIGVQGTFQDSNFLVSKILYVKDAPAQIQAQQWAPVTILTVLATINGIAPQYTKASMNTKAGIIPLVFKESSNNNLILNFDKNGDGQPDVYEVSFSDSLDCGKYISWINKAIPILQTQYGVDANTYYSILMVPPIPLNCGGVGGIASIGDPASGVAGENFAAMLNLFDCSRGTAGCASIPIHELGHNMGQEHSGNITWSEYGDQSCFMGNYGGGNINANIIHRESLGAFLAYPNAIKTVTASKKITLSSLNTDPSSTQNPVGIKVKKTNGSYYYVSLRDEGGFEANLKAEFHKNVQVHRIQAYPNKSYLDDTLSTNESFTDNANHIQIKVDSINATGTSAEISIIFNGVLPDDLAQAQDQNVTAFAQDPSTTIQLSYTDPDGPGPYTFTVTKFPTKGTITLDSANGSIVYKPTAGKSGPDLIKWKVNDGINDSNEASVVVTLVGSSVNGQEVASGAAVSSGCSATGENGVTQGMLLIILLFHTLLLRSNRNTFRNEPS